MDTAPHPFIQLARQSVGFFLKHRRPMPCPADLSPDLKQPSGAFVSIKKETRLRGCIGTLHPQEPNLAMEIIENAVKAASVDPRFAPVTPEEFRDLNFSIDVIAPMEKIRSLTDLDPQVFGLVVKSGSRQGVLLPALPGIPSVDAQVRVCRTKGGIREEEPQEMFRFKVRRYS